MDLHSRANPDGKWGKEEEDDDEGRAASWWSASA
uniref:Uncharacterized protein n=1 Tax=Arundo donax TaxID=35708 RepID=A0A0A9GU07_ARUDO